MAGFGIEHQLASPYDPASMADLRRLAVLGSRLFLAAAIALAATLVAAPRPATAIGCLTNCTTLSFALQGDGNGEVVTLTGPTGSANGLIDCSISGGVVSGKCSFKYQNTFPPSTLTIYYRVINPAHYTSSRPSGSTCLDTNLATTPCTCPGLDLAQTSCTFAAQFSANTTVTWTFLPLNPKFVEIFSGGTGFGTVTSSPAGINCGTVCRFDFPRGTVITVTAAPAAGSHFAGWSNTGGLCTALNPVCTFGVTADIALSVAFDLTIATPPPTPQPTRTPAPTPGHTPGPTATASSSAPTATAHPTAGTSSSPGTSGSGGSGSTTTPSAPGASAPGGVGTSASEGAPETAGPSGVGELGSTLPSSLAPAGNSPSGVAAGAAGSDGLLIATVLALGIAVAGIAIAFGLRARGSGSPKA